MAGFANGVWWVQENALCRFDAAPAFFNLKVTQQLADTGGDSFAIHVAGAVLRELCLFVDFFGKCEALSSDGPFVRALPKKECRVDQHSHRCWIYR